MKQTPPADVKVFIADFDKKVLVEKFRIKKQESYPIEYPAAWLTVEQDGKEMVEGKDFRLENNCELHPGCYCVMNGNDETKCKRYNPVTSLIEKREYPLTPPADVSHLLKPRIKVENNYPRSPYKHYEIICDPMEEEIQWAKEFTVNFRFLKWYEEREEIEMPEYVRIINDGSFYRIDGDCYDEKAKEVFVKFPEVDTVIKTTTGYKWLVGKEYVYLISKKNTWIEIHGVDMQPTTKSEYETYINKTK